MFAQLVKNQLTLARYRNGPFAQEREQYLTHLSQRGYGKGRLTGINIQLLAIAQQLLISVQKRLTKVEVCEAATIKPTMCSSGFEPKVGIMRFDGGRFQPRLHDFRHTFAVRRLISWYREGKDVQRLLPHLSTYLGHVDIDSTAHYLTMTRELLQEANRCFEIYASGEVRHG
jgi:integrase